MVEEVNQVSSYMTDLHVHLLDALVFITYLIGTQKVVPFLTSSLTLHTLVLTFTGC